MILDWAYSKRLMLEFLTGDKMPGWSAHLIQCSVSLTPDKISDYFKADSKLQTFWNETSALVIRYIYEFLSVMAQKWTNLMSMSLIQNDTKMFRSRKFFGMRRTKAVAKHRTSVRPWLCCCLDFSSCLFQCRLSHSGKQRLTIEKKFWIRRTTCVW